MFHLYKKNCSVCIHGFLHHMICSIMCFELFYFSFSYVLQAIYILYPFYCVHDFPVISTSTIFTAFFAIYFIGFWYLWFCGDILLNYSFYNIVLRCILVFPHVFMSYTWYILQCSYNSLEMLHGVYYVVHIVLIGRATTHFQFFTQYHEFFFCVVFERGCSLA
jgi:hypothetical protein